MNETLMNFQKKTKVLSKEETVKLFKEKGLSSVSENVLKIF